MIITTLLTKEVNKMKMTQENFDEMIGKIGKVFADYGLEHGWDLEAEEYSRQQLIYVGLYEDGEGNFTTEPPEEE